MNSIVLIGRLTKDPELRYTPSGKAVASLRLAVDRGTVNQHGERETDFINIVCWEKQAEAVTNYLQKGLLVAVQGRLQVRQYTTDDGQRRERAEVVAQRVQFLERSPQQGGQDGGQAPPMGEETEAPDDDVPF